MPMFKNKPVVIEAVQVTAADFNGNAKSWHEAWDGKPFSDAPDWIVRAIVDGQITPHSRGGSDYAQWDIVTLGGVMTAQPGDWIIKGIKGELCPCKPDIFAATYEPA